MKRFLGWLCASVLAVSILCGSALCDQIVIPEMDFIRQQPIPENEAMEFLKSMGVGWNLGNTFDAVRANWNANADEMTLETSWQRDITTEPLFDLLKNAGISTVRMPVSWHDHLEPDGTISERWLSRVQQVVDWAISKDLYVILDAHHDVMPGVYYPSSEYYDVTAAFIRGIWSQLADRFKDYDEHLLFEPINEPRQTNTDHEWSFSAGNPDCLDAADCINRLNQLFVDTVRMSGGYNETRYLMIPGYAHAPGPVLDDSFILPEDDADNRLIVTVHTYTPYDFAQNTRSSNRDFDVRDMSVTQQIAQTMSALYKKYIVNGIPVVVGEYGALNKKGNTQARVNYTAYATVAAAARNIPIVWWDNNSVNGSGENFGIVDRKNCTFYFPEIVETMVRYGGYDKVLPQQ